MPLWPRSTRPAPALVYAGYIGGTADDDGSGIAVDGAGNAYVTGDTNSDQATFPCRRADLTYTAAATPSWRRSTRPARPDLRRLHRRPSRDDGNGIAVDGAGNAYVTGYTDSDQATFPVIGGPDLTYNGGGYDAFVAKVERKHVAIQAPARRRPTDHRRRPRRMAGAPAPTLLDTDTTPPASPARNSTPRPPT